MNTKAKTETGKTASVRHRYMLKTETGNVMQGELAVPSPGQPTRYRFTWLNPSTAEDRATFEKWRESIQRDFSEAVGREIELTDDARCQNAPEEFA